ncbi:MAG: 3-phosphoglycerate dehydrogenase [Ruminococcaceae bacterium]|nr:3-phosphoglycerate dehydrogenase [Oscillospiraceae bacterium]
MNNIKLMNKIAKVGTDVFDRAKYTVGADIDAPDAIMVRSAALHDMEFNPELRAISRCGAGVNNIPIDRCTEAGIAVFNTPGANANGVKELAVAALLLASRDIVGGIAWANTLEENVVKSVEAGKSQFGGTEITGKTLGVIGLGAIGGLVANAADALGMDVMGCDPYISVAGAWALSHAVKRASAYEEIYKNADYITIHVPATPSTKNMINKDTIAMMKDGVKIINLSRADLVNIADLKEALASGKVAKYITDFPTEESINVPGIVAIPHLGASTAESEDNCAVMAAHELVDFLEYGNIKNSVNFPNVSIPASGFHRLGVMHKNVPAVLAKLTAAISEVGLNIENMANGSKGDNAYTLFEINGKLSADVVAKLTAIDEVIKAYEF